MTNEAIIAEILKQRRAEEDQHAITKAVGRADAIVTDVKYKIFWLYNNELDSRYGDFQRQRVIHNAPSAIGIAKNCKLGEVLITRKNGSYTVNKRTFKVAIQSFTGYIPSDPPKVDAIKGKIEIPGAKPFLFRSAYELLHRIEEPPADEDKINLEQLLKDQLEAEKLGRELNKEEAAQLELLYNITRYIRDNNELRLQPILDPIQEEIKRSKIFNGILVIDGGPGTGKTTTLIQRIKFLIDPTIQEYWEQGDRLLQELQGNNGWIFFSPSRHLLNFLRHAMVEEGLKATDTRSKVWSDYLNSEVMIGYNLVGADRPFKLFTREIGGLLNNEHTLLQTLMETLEKFMLKELKQRIERSRSFKIRDETLHRASLPLIANGASLADANSITRFIIAADNLSENYGNEIKTKIRQINDEHQRNADLILVRLKRDETKYAEVVTFLKEQFDKRQTPDEEEDNEEAEIDEMPTPGFNEGVELRKSIRLWLRNYLRNKVNPDEKIPERQRKWVTHISEYCNDLPIDELGNKSLYVKNIQPLVSGSSSLFFRRFTALYKNFRRTLPEWFESNHLPGSAHRMKKILDEKEAKLHYDERCLLVLFINSIIRQLQKQNASVYRNDGDLFIQAYKDQQRYIVAIDEASDFSLLELSCMHSFSNPLYDCTTLSGDLMQRMTKGGIADWETFIGYIGNGQIKSLQTSYRQSPTLLDLAKKFYEKITGKNALYTPYTTASRYEPKPKVKKISDDEEKIGWIANEMLFIYKTYGGKIPSIAIFTYSDDAVIRLSRQLRHCEFLTGNGIETQGITEEGGITQKGKVGIFNIENIKGLEFEAVFFIDVDKIENADAELIQKYIYVGLSRAAYYLFITYENDLPDGLDFLSSFE